MHQFFSLFDKQKSVYFSYAYAFSFPRARLCLADNFIYSMFFGRARAPSCPHRTIVSKATKRATVYATASHSQKSGRRKARARLLHCRTQTQNKIRIKRTEAYSLFPKRPQHTTIKASLPPPFPKTAGAGVCWNCFIICFPSGKRVQIHSSYR